MTKNIPAWHILLVGGFNPSEKYESNWIISPNRDENKKCFKPPPSLFQNPLNSYIHKPCPTLSQTLSQASNIHLSSNGIIQGGTGEACQFEIHLRLRFGHLQQTRKHLERDLKKTKTNIYIYTYTYNHIHIATSDSCYSWRWRFTKTSISIHMDPHHFSILTTNFFQFSRDLTWFRFAPVKSALAKSCPVAMSYWLLPRKGGMSKGHLWNDIYIYINTYIIYYI